MDAARGSRRLSYGAAGAQPIFVSITPLLMRARGWTPIVDHCHRGNRAEASIAGRIEPPMIALALATIRVMLCMF